MKKTFPSLAVLAASVSVLIAQPSEFDFTPNNAYGGIIAAIEVSGSPASSSDWIAAFDEDNNCAGAVQLVVDNGQAYCNLLAYGNDATTPDMDEGIDAGETLTFKLWVEATGEIFDHPMDIEPVEGWDAGLNGTTVPGWDFPDGKQINFNTVINDTPASNYDDASIVFPNPIVNKASIIYTLTKFDLVSVALFDANGKQSITLIENQTLQAGQHNIQLNANNLASGIYYLKVQGKENNAIRKLMIINSF